MNGLIALVGGDEFRHGCEDMDRAILKATGVERPRVLIVPTAAAFENPSRAASNGVSHFSRLGADASPLMVLDSTHASDEKLLSPIDNAQVVYFTGGNPSHLLETLTGSLLLSRMKDALERGVILAGSSAGAMVMGSWMRFRQWREALGVVPDIAALPHHERANPDETAAELARSAPEGVTALGINGMTGCLGSAGEWQVLGAGAVTVYHGGQWQRFTSGQSFSLG